MRTNLFPAIAISGPPNSGKSVLAFMLTQRLREIGLSHYLLRAVPDGEGDWFYRGKPGWVRTLRLQRKTGYSHAFIEHMVQTIDRRLLPLLVDIGGDPRGEQFEILKACTHSILLYRSETEYLEWQRTLSALDLLPVAELRSVLPGSDNIEQTYPILKGAIGGLAREEENRRSGMAFGALFDRVAGICHYESAFLEHEHLRHAPFPTISERDLAQKVGTSVRGETPFWEPGHLSAIGKYVGRGKPLALYGRGPVWLAAMITAHSHPAPVALFDARYGWITLPEVRFQAEGNINVKVTPCLELNANWAEISLPYGVIEPDQICLSPLLGEDGVVLSGPLPRWAFAALARQLAPERAWVGVYDANLNKAVVVHSTSVDVAVGSVLSKPD